MATTWLVSKAATASDSNGGTSQAIRSSGSDGIVNATAGTTLITSITATWTAADIGHGICAGGVFRLISAVTPGTTASVTTSNGSAAVTSSAAFTSSMVGQAITGPGIAANTVVQAFTDASHITLSANAGAGAGAGTATFYVMLTTTGNVAFSAGSAKAWVVGGMWSTFNGSVFNANSPVQGGDTVYFGAGIYRELPSTSLTNPTSALSLIGDVDGVQTGTSPGEVRVTNVTNDLTGQSTMFTISKNYIQCSKMVFATINASLLNISVGTVHDYSFTDCAFYSSANSISSYTVSADTAVNATFRRCLFFVLANTSIFSWSLTTSASADYDTNILFENCVFLAGGGSVVVTATGAAAFKGGGVRVRNCSMFMFGAALSANNANLSTTYPCEIKNCLIVANNSTAIVANTTGQILEDYNVVNCSTVRSNTTQGLHTTGGNTISILPNFGQEFTWGGPRRQLYSLAPDSLFNTWGDDGNAPSTDFLNRPRPAGGNRLVTTGTATAGSATTLTDTNNSFGASTILQGATIKITGGTGSGQYKIIKSHTNTVITAYGNWVTTPDATSTYAIYFGTVGEYFQCTSGSTTTAVQSSATWATNMWTGFTGSVVSGTGNGQTFTVTSNITTTLTIPALGVGLDSTSVVKLYRKTDENTVNKAVGALELHDQALRETTLTDAGGIAWKLYGWADQRIYVPVLAQFSTFTIKCSFDTDHGNTNKPQVALIADGEIGVSSTTATATGSAGSGTFETLTITFTPTAQGVAIFELRSRSDKPTGRAIFDTVILS